MNVASPDYYELLQVDPKADPEVIKRAYRTLCGLYHPDIVPPQERAAADYKMALINAAYQILSDPQARREYDKSRLGSQRPEGASATRTPAPPAAAADAKRCYRHPERPRISLCMICGHSICGECRTEEAMLVVCPDCTALRRGGKAAIHAGSGMRQAAETIRALPASPVAVFRRAGSSHQLMWGFVVLIGFVAMFPLFLMASANVVALRFPGAINLVWGSSIVISTVAAAAVGALLIISGAYLRFRYVAVSVSVLLAAMVLGLSQTQSVREADFGKREFQNGHYGRAAVGFTYALAMGDHSQETSDNLGRTYLRLFRQKTAQAEDTSSNLRRAYAEAALEILDRDTQRPADRHSPGRKEPLSLSPDECVGIFLAAKTASSGASTRWFAIAQRLLRPDPQQNDQYPAHQYCRLVLGLTLFLHSEAVAQGLRARMHKFAKPFSDLVKTEEDRRRPPDEPPLQKQARECLKPFQNIKLNDWDPDLVFLHDDLVAAQQKLFQKQPQNQNTKANQGQDVRPDQQPSEYQPTPQQGQQPGGSAPQ